MVLLKVTTLLLSYVTQGCPALALKVRSTGAQYRQQQLLSRCSLHGAGNAAALIPMEVIVCTWACVQHKSLAAQHHIKLRYSAAVLRYLSLSVFSRDSQGVDRGAAAVTDLQITGRGSSHRSRARWS